MTRPMFACWLIVLGVLTFAARHTLADEHDKRELARDLTVQGIAFQQKGDHGAALAYFERARRDVDHPKIHYFMAKSLDALGRYDEALAEFRGVDEHDEMVKYAGEVKAYIRAIVAEREQVRLAAALAQLQMQCPSMSPAAPEPSPKPQAK